MAMPGYDFALRKSYITRRLPPTFAHPARRDADIVVNNGVSREFHHLHRRSGRGRGCRALVLRPSL